MKVVIIIVAIILGVFAWGFVGTKSPPARHKNLTRKRLDSLVNALYKRGYDGATLVVETRDQSMFVQIRKEISSEKTRLRSDFPLVDWSRQYYPRVKELLDSTRASYREAPTSDLATRGTVDKVLVIDFGTDVGKVAEYIDTVFRGIFGVNIATSAEAYLENVSPRDVEIGAKSLRH